MIRRTNGWGAASVIVATLPLAFQIATEARQAAQSSAAASPAFFESSVRPVLAANCYDCHTDQRMGGLRLDSREGLLKGNVTHDIIA